MLESLLRVASTSFLWTLITSLVVLGFWAFWLKRLKRIETLALFTEQCLSSNQTEENGFQSGRLNSTSDVSENTRTRSRRPACIDVRSGNGLVGTAAGAELRRT